MSEPITLKAMRVNRRCVLTQDFRITRLAIGATAGRIQGLTR